MFTQCRWAVRDCWAADGSPLWPTAPIADEVATRASASTHTAIRWTKGALLHGRDGCHGDGCDGCGTPVDGFTGEVPSCARGGIGGRAPGDRRAPGNGGASGVRQVVQSAPLRAKAVGPALPPVWPAW
ncbi:hypothetical protein GCM10010344_06940 [Streptomyces bluensis]|nr:hypothetical protein GCM10010344_06940 [Streptomyces bluensis]